MLRDYFNLTALQSTLEQFDGIEFTSDSYGAVKLAKSLSPDSFIWKLEINNERYYLYAEDYVPSIKHVYTEIEKVAGAGNGTLVEVKDKIEFDRLAPVQAAEVYQKPDNYEAEMQRYAAESGYDLVFLYKVNIATMASVKGAISG